MLTPDELSRLAELYGRAYRGLGQGGIGYALILIQPDADPANGTVLGFSSNISAGDLVEVFKHAAASTDRNQERLRPGVQLGDVTPKGPAA